ncbi:LOW QUALITY PROTEIN: hypothetical protein CRUP_021401, partial [Coryphaenoides rupestris]
NSQNSQRCALQQEAGGELCFHAVRGSDTAAPDEQTVVVQRGGGGGGGGGGGAGEEKRTLVFTSRPLRCSETVLVRVTRSGAHSAGGSSSSSTPLSYGVTSCDPATLRPCDLPPGPEALVDRQEFWAVGGVGAPLHSGDVLGFSLSGDGELAMSRNGAGAGVRLCVDNSRPLWMFYGLHGNVTQLRILGVAEAHVAAGVQHRVHGVLMVHSVSHHRGGARGAGGGAAPVVHAGKKKADGGDSGWPKGGEEVLEVAPEPGVDPWGSRAAWHRGVGVPGVEDGEPGVDGPRGPIIGGWGGGGVEGAGLEGRGRGGQLARSNLHEVEEEEEEEGEEEEEVAASWSTTGPLFFNFATST